MDYLTAVSAGVIIGVSVLALAFLIALGVVASSCSAMTMHVSYVKGHSVQHKIVGHRYIVV